jgi:sirohydrochlorin ferrochelatase
VLAVPGVAGAPGTESAVGLAALIESAHTGKPALIGHLTGDGSGLRSVLAAVGAERSAESDMPAAVVVPLITGPDPELDKVLREAISASGVPAVAAEPLGPHPLIAQALHDRLAEAGLARADRVRMLTMVTAAGGVIVGTMGGEAAVRETAEVTAVLLASRLAVPVIPASLDGAPGVLDPATAATALRNSGATDLALAPCIIGSETDPGRVAAVAAEIDVAYAAPLGEHPSLAQLAALRYVEALEGALKHE